MKRPILTNRMESLPAPVARKNRKISTYSYDENVIRNLRKESSSISLSRDFGLDADNVSNANGIPECENGASEFFENIPLPDPDDPDLFDPFCDPENPKEIKFQDISTAAYRIRSGIMRTPCERSRMSSLVGMELYFKKDYQQMTGSFKERGARYTLMSLSNEEKERGVVAASAGNHALALAYHGQTLNIPVTVVMPLIAPLMKINSCAMYGAKVIVRGNDLAESKRIAMKIGKLHKMIYINGYDHPHILAGQGSLGLEVLEQVPDLDAMVIPVGGGGLIAGVALAVKTLNPNVMIIGAESERCPSFAVSMKHKKVTYTKAESTLADGLAVSNVGVNSLQTGMKLIDRMVEVSEDYIALSILRLIEIEKAVVEGAGATGLAAILSGSLPELLGKKVVVPLCGGNIDTTVLGRCIERGLVADGRISRFELQISDRPGGIAELTTLMASLGVSIKDIQHERAWVKSDIFSVQVKCICETRDSEHATEFERALRNRYSSVVWSDRKFFN